MGARKLRKALLHNGWAGILAAYKLAMESMYLWYIYGFSQLHGWWGTFYRIDVTLSGYVLGWIAFVAIVFLFRTTLQKPLEEYRFSEFVLLVLLLLSVIPGMAMCSIGAFPWEYRFLFCWYWLLFFLLGRVLSVVKLRDSVDGGRLSPRGATGLLFAVGTVVAVSIVFIFFYYGGGRFFVAGLQSPEVYVQRLNFSKVALMFPLNYIKANAGVVCLFLLLFFLGNRRYGWVGIVLFIWYMEFSCSPNKIELFSILIGAFIYAVRNYLTINRMLCIAVGFVLAGMGLFDFGKSLYVMSFLCRTLFETNWLSYCYYDFFQNHAPMLYRFFEVPVLDRGKIPFLIGAQYLDNPGTHANNGLLGDAFLMAGVYGVILGPILWQIYLYIVDKASNRLEWWVKLAVSIFWVSTMQNGSFATSMLSHGGVAIIILAYLCGSARPDTEVLHNRLERPHLLKW